ncbi:MAG: hypothetical protein P4M13_10320 [Alphaproteobacteria bacterium]|nr:hypothetical protein [Alphaproteobacteria bacterium]
MWHRSATSEPTEWAWINPSDIFWTCLGDKCPKSCCGSDFDLRPDHIFEGDPLDSDILLKGFREQADIVSNYSDGSKAVFRDGDGESHLRLRQDGACYYWEGGRCAIQENKPAICRAFPLSPSLSRGVIADLRCPGFEAGERLKIKMDKRTYTAMLQGIIELEEYKLLRLSLKLNTLTKREKNKPKFRFGSVKGPLAFV